MAGDKKVYDKAIREGLNYAWEAKWDKALEAYQTAQAEMPDDAAVHNYLGLAYLELERLEAALEAYATASRLDADDPGPLGRMAEIHERLGQRHAAADALFSMAEIHRCQRDWTQAIQGFQRVLQLYPDHLQARSALADIYAQLDQPQRAVKEHLALAQIMQRQGQVDKAMVQCRQALEIDPRNPEISALFKAMQRGKPMGEVATVVDAATGLRGDTRVGPAPGEGGASPADMARDKALEELAGIPFEDRLPGSGAEPSSVQPADGPDDVRALVAKAIDCQTRGSIDEAIACYSRLIQAGVDRPAVHFTLGLLYQQRSQFEPAVAEFAGAIHSPEYTLGCHFALGECYRSQGRVADALKHYVQALKIIDLGTVQGEKREDLVDLYDGLADNYIAKGDPGQALAFASSLSEFLSTKGWQEKVREARQRLDGMSEDGTTISLAEFLEGPAPRAEAILTAMSLSQEYAGRGAFTAAVEVCYKAIEAAPTYLPLHLRLAEIYAQNERIEDAVAKYQAVADLYLVREESGQAIGVYKRMLRLKPMDVGIRSRLIDLLTSSGEIDQALEQYVALADTYYDLAQVNKVLEKYTEALRLVPRASNEAEWRLRLLHNMLDIQMRRGHWREAAELCQQIVAVAPDDERARLDLIDLNYKLGRVKGADKETLAMIEHYRSGGEDERALALLQEAVRLHPRQMPLRARMARVYIDADMREEAVRELDALGELQLDAGLRQQAITTVRYIISLNPKNVAAYRQLLAQL